LAAIGGDDVKVKVSGTPGTPFSGVYGTAAGGTDAGPFAEVAGHWLNERETWLKNKLEEEE